MLKNPSNSAHPSQFDANEAAQRLVLLGASNLSMTFPMVIETARAMFARPLEIYVAMGFGRSYGQESKFFGKKFSGILHADLWTSLNDAQPLPTSAIIADVGNDLAYGVSVSTIVEWVDQTLNRLDAHRASTALNNVPLASLSAVGALRYSVLREVLFPSCRVPRREMLSRASQLSDALDEVANQRQMPVFSGDSAWYGLDPIHPRRASAGEIWLRMLSAVAPSDAVAAWRRPSLRGERALRALQRRAWHSIGRSATGLKAVERLSDGTTVALF